jgi:curved DNA-binding protein CbpA
MTAADDAAIDAYKILQVDHEADPEVIQAAYRRLAQKWHPDVATGQEAADRMVAINRAWEILGEPGRRAAYDRERTAIAARVRAAAEAERPAPPAPTAAPPAASTTPHRPPARPAAPGAHAREARPERPPEDVSRDWTMGRSTMGSGYDPASMRTADEAGAAGPPPGQPSGSVITFGRYTGWSIGEIARSNLEYLEWLDRMPIGRMYRDEIDVILRQVGRRRSAQPDKADRPGLFRRR